MMIFSFFITLFKNYIEISYSLCMTKMRQILIIGNNDNGCTPEIESAAYEAGKEVAKSNSVLITGGLGGVMKAASHGAKDANGLTIGIIPQDDSSLANEYCDIVIPSGMGLSRDFLNALSADGVIVVVVVLEPYLKYVLHICTKNQLPLSKILVEWLQNMLTSIWITEKM